MLFLNKTAIITHLQCESNANFTSLKLFSFSSLKHFGSSTYFKVNHCIEKLFTYVSHISDIAIYVKCELIWNILFNELICKNINIL